MCSDLASYSHVAQTRGIVIQILTVSELPTERVNRVVMAGYKLEYVSLTKW